MTTYEYDEQGRLSQSVTKQAEGEWDQTSRNLVEGLARYDAELCPGCHMHPVILDDPENNVFTIEPRLCNMCALQDQHERVVAERDEEETPKDSNGTPKWASATERRPADGRHFTLRPLTAEELAERERAKTTRRRRHG